MRERIEKIVAKSSKILVVGYSPTGGGHIGRVFNIIDQAITDKHLVKGDTVIFHYPLKCEENMRLELNDIILKLQKAGIHIVLSLGDKAVFGPWKKDGSSDDAKIIERFAFYPLRKKNKKSHIFDAGVIWPIDKKEEKQVLSEQELTPVQYIHQSEVIPDLTISAKDLMQSLVKEAKQDRIFVLTDMDPYLQKAAIAAGIPPEQCLDQQNHGILIIDADDPMISENAYLAKVLAGSGGKVSHIGLGEKNTLFPIKALASELGIENKTTPAQAKAIVINLLESKGSKIPLDKPYTSNTAGIMWPDGLDKKDVKQIVYVYAHNATPSVGEHIRTQINAKNPNYTNKVFLFCGPKAVPGYNALHLAYLADADGVTAAGAGTTGEFAYLHTKAKAQSKLLLLPQPGQNEQKANADYIAGKYKEYIFVEEKPADIPKKLDQLVKSSDAKAAVSDVSPLLTAVSDTETYTKQASDILFRKTVHGLSEELRMTEMKMYGDSTLKMTRRYLKSTFQLLEAIRHGKQFPLAIKLKQKDEPIIFQTIQEVVKFFEKDSKLIGILASEKDKKDISKSQIEPPKILRDKVIAFFKKYEKISKEISSEERTTIAKEIDDLQEEFGAKMITGF